MKRMVRASGNSPDDHMQYAHHNINKGGGRIIVGWHSAPEIDSRSLNRSQSFITQHISAKKNLERKTERESREPSSINIENRNHFCFPASPHLMLKKITILSYPTVEPHI
jgi:hypothetical protein